MPGFDTVQRGSFGMGGSGVNISAPSPDTAEVVESEVRSILERCHLRSRDILRQNRVLLEEMSAHLLEHEALDGSKMEAFLSRAVQASSLEDRPPTETEEISHEKSAK